MATIPNNSKRTKRWTLLWIVEIALRLRRNPCFEIVMTFLRDFSLTKTFAAEAGYLCKEIYFIFIKTVSLTPFQIHPHLLIREFEVRIPSSACYIRVDFASWKSEKSSEFEEPPSSFRFWFAKFSSNHKHFQ